MIITCGYCGAYVDHQDNSHFSARCPKHPSERMCKERLASHRCFTCGVNYKMYSLVEELVYKVNFSKRALENN